MENKTPEIVVIDKNAIVKFTVTAGMIERLQGVMSYLIKEKTEEQFQAFYEEFKSYNEIAKGQKAFTEEWMTPLTTMVLFLKEIEKEADVQGFLIKVDLEEYIKNSIDDINSSDS